MNVIGIVGEYNPFHFGHEYHIKMSRERALERIAPLSAPCPATTSSAAKRRCIPSSPAPGRLPRRRRSRAGASSAVVLSSAEGFARGAVALLSAAGATHLSFGSEAGETGPLEELAGLLVTPEINEEIKAVLAQDASLLRRRAAEGRRREAWQPRRAP